MKPVTFSKLLPYVRDTGQLYGVENLFDSQNLLNFESTKLRRFTAHVFTANIMIDEDGHGNIDTDEAKLATDLTFENDEIALKDRNNETISRHFDDDQVIIPLVRPGYSIYGHWLLDLLPRVNFFKSLNPSLKYKLLVHEATPSWAISIVETLQIGEVEKVRTGEWVSGKFFLMSPIRHHDYVSEIAYAEDVMPIPARVGSDKFYLSRKKVGVQYRSFHNSEAIERLFEENGFQIIYPEQHSIPEQIELFANARVLAGEGGSALHNNVFCAPGTTIINLQSGRQNHFIQSSLCHWYKQSAVYVFGPSDSDDWGAGFSIPEEYCRQILTGLDN